MKVKLSECWAWASASLIIIHTEQASDEGPGHHDLSDLDERANSVLQIQKISIIAIDSHYPLKKRGEKKKAKSSSLKLWHLLGAIGYALCVIIHTLNEETSHVYINQYFTIIIIIIITLSPIGRIKPNKPDR